MRLGVLSDIHGNAVALDQVLADLERHPVDRLVCLGDCVQGGPQPAETVARLRALDLPIVMGNADAWLLSGVQTSSEAPSPERQRILDDVRAWSLARLDARDREFIAAFAPTLTVSLGEGRSLLAFHGSPASFDELILPETAEDEFARILGPHRAHLLAGGHVHVQFVRHLGETFHFNPGSVGVAYRHRQPDDTFRLDPWAEYAVLTAGNRALALEFRRVPFDVQALMRVYLDSCRPHAQDTLRHYRR